MQQRTRQQQSLKAFFEERRDLLSPLSQKKDPKKGKKKTTNDTLINSWTLGRNLFLFSPPKPCSQVDTKPYCQIERFQFDCQMERF